MDNRSSAFKYRGVGKSARKEKHCCGLSSTVFFGVFPYVNGKNKVV